MTFVYQVICVTLILYNIVEIYRVTEEKKLSYLNDIYHESSSAFGRVFFFGIALFMLIYTVPALITPLPFIVRMLAGVLFGITAITAVIVTFLAAVILILNCVLRVMCLLNYDDLPEEIARYEHPFQEFAVDLGEAIVTVYLTIQIIHVI